MSDKFLLKLNIVMLEVCMAKVGEALFTSDAMSDSFSPKPNHYVLYVRRKSRPDDRHQ